MWQNNSITQKTYNSKYTWLPFLLLPPVGILFEVPWIDVIASEDGPGRYQPGGASILITSIEDPILQVYNHDYINWGYWIQFNFV